MHTQTRETEGGGVNIPKENSLPSFVFAAFGVATVNPPSSKSPLETSLNQAGISAGFLH